MSAIQRPNVFMVHEVIATELLPDLKGGELKVLLYISLKTLGWHKESDAISLTQLENGLVTKDGRRIDRGTGLCRKSLVAAIVALEQRGVLIAERGSSTANGFETTRYRLNFKPLDPSVESTLGSVSAPADPSGKSTLASGKSIPTPLAKRIPIARGSLSIDPVVTSEASPPSGVGLLEETNNSVSSPQRINQQASSFSLRSTNEFGDDVFDRFEPKTTKPPTPAKTDTNGPANNAALASARPKNIGTVSAMSEKAQAALADWCAKQGRPVKTLKLNLTQAERVEQAAERHSLEIMAACATWAAERGIADVVKWARGCDRFAEDNDPNFVRGARNGRGNPDAEAIPVNRGGPGAPRLNPRQQAIVDSLAPHYPEFA